LTKFPGSNPQSGVRRKAALIVAFLTAANLSRIKIIFTFLHNFFAAPSEPSARQSLTSAAKR
jgi:hypothetical protein